MSKRAVKHLNLYMVCNAFFLLVILLGIYTIFFMNGVDRSLWLDEAFLASSFSKRSFAGIFLEGRFDYMQSAPLAWLYFEKVLAQLFGNKPYVLRMGSVLAYLLTIAALIFIQHHFYQSRFPLAAAALYANTPFILRYSTMFKPYAMDGFITLLILIVYGLWKERKLKSRWLTLIWAVLIWCAQPACFVIGGCGVCEFAASCIRKNRKEILRILLVGATIGASFLIYYFAWIRRMTSVDGMQDFWQEAFFPLLPRSFSDIKKAADLTAQVLYGLGWGWLFILAFCAVGLILALWNRDRILLSGYLGILVGLFASFLHMYPMSNRLWLFSYPFLILSAAVTVESLAQRKKICEIMAALAIFLVAFANHGFYTYHTASNVYMNGEELETELAYLKDYMEENDPVYIYVQSRGGFEYYTGYGNRSFGGEDNVIMGEDQFGPEDLNREEAEKVVSHDRIWIVSSHLYAGCLTGLLQAAHENGHLEMVSNAHGTPLWYYCRSLDDARIHFTMTIKDMKENSGYKEADVLIKNDGEAYLNNEFEQIYLINQSDQTIYPISRLVAPGKSVKVRVRFPADEAPEFTLRGQFGQIALDDSIKINKK